MKENNSNEEKWKSITEVVRSINSKRSKFSLASKCEDQQAVALCEAILAKDRNQVSQLQAVQNSMSHHFGKGYEKNF